MTTTMHTRRSAPAEELTVGSERIAFKLTSEQTGGELAALHVRFPPGGGPPHLHRHDPFELYRVRSGELTIEDALAAVGERQTDPAPARGAAYLTITRFCGDPDQLPDDYREHSSAMSAVGRDHGLIMHAGAKTDSGFLIVNLWPSRWASEAAARDPRRLSVLEQAEISPDQIRREHHEVAHYVVVR